VLGALPEPGRWGDEWNAPLITLLRRGPIEVYAMRSDQSTKQAQRCPVFVYAGGKPGRRGCSIRGWRECEPLACVLAADDVW